MRSVKVGLIGAGIQLSKSPSLHMREGAAQGLDYSYQLFDLNQGGSLDGFLDQAEAQGFAGVNITYPCKQAVLTKLHDLSDEARAIGAVNTVVFRAGQRIGHNTDCSGFAENFQRGLPDVATRSALLLGAGGAGVAVAVALRRLGVRRLLIHDPVPANLAALVTRLNADSPLAIAVPDLATLPADIDGIVNASPIGMNGHPGLPLPAELVTPARWIADVVYVPLETELLVLARAKNCRVLPGGGMAVFQAVKAFEHFTGMPANTERMLAHFLDMNA